MTTVALSARAALLAHLTVAALAGQAATIFVDSNAGNNANSGASWNLAKATLQAAIAAAQPNDTIAVRAGTYLVGGAYGALAVSKNLTLLGGYTACGVRSPRTAPTILQNMGSGSATMLTLSGASTVATVNGFRFLNGSYALGGAIHASGGTFRIEDCWFSACTASLAGGAVTADGCTITLERNRFSNNASQGSAGAFYANNSAIAVYSNFFEYNTAANSGGSIYIGGSSGSINNNTFAYSQSPSGGVFYYGGFSNVNFRNNVLRNVTTTGAGSGAVHRAASFILNNYNNHFYLVTGGLYSHIQIGNNDTVGDPLMSGNSLLHLTGTSPCRDTGDAFASVGAFDYDGDPRVGGAAIDRGADEIRTGKVLFLTGCISIAHDVPFLGNGTLLLRSVDEPGVGVMLHVPPSTNGQLHVDGIELPVGTYEAVFAGSNTLVRKLPLIELSESSENALDIRLISGDIDRDNAVTVFDYNLLSQYFDRDAGQPGWDEPDSSGIRPSDADLDFDGMVTVFDYGILSDNFDRVGDEF